MPTDPIDDPRHEPRHEPGSAGRTTVVVLEPVRDLTREATAVLMLTLGSLVPLVGWLVGAALLWSSDRWSRRLKVLGTLVWPFGYPAAFFFFTGGSQLCGKGDPTCGSPFPAYAVIPLLVLLVGGPVLVGWVLLIVAGSRRRVELARRRRLLAASA